MPLKEVAVQEDTTVEAVKSWGKQVRGKLRTEPLKNILSEAMQTKPNTGVSTVQTTSATPLTNLIDEEIQHELYKRIKCLLQSNYFQPTIQFSGSIMAHLNTF